MIAAFMVGLALGSAIVYAAGEWGRFAARHETTKHRSCWDPDCTLNLGHIGGHASASGGTTWWR